MTGQIAVDSGGCGWYNGGAEFLYFLGDTAAKVIGDIMEVRSMGTKNDYEVVYIPLEEILNSEVLSDEQKLQMIKSIVNKVLHGEKENA